MGAAMASGGAPVSEFSEPAAASTRPPPIAVLRLIDGFEFLLDERPMRIGTAAQRLLGLLALRRAPISRGQAAGILWPEVPSRRAAANLRSVTWRFQRPYVPFDTSLGNLRLAADLRVDLHEAQADAQLLLRQRSPLAASQLQSLLQANLHGELLPGWSESWLVDERERFRQLRLHALESLCAQLTAAGWHGPAVQTGLAVVASDPLRETGHSVLIKAYLAEGNYGDALRQFRRYCELAQTELHVAPSPRLRENLHAALRGRSTAAAASGPTWSAQREIACCSAGHFGCVLRTAEPVRST